MLNDYLINFLFEIFSFSTFIVALNKSCIDKLLVYNAGLGQNFLLADIQTLLL